MIFLSFGMHFPWQMTAGRCHTLLSPVTEESGEEGSNSEISSPPACRSPSPVANADASVNQVSPSAFIHLYYLQTSVVLVQCIISHLFSNAECRSFMLCKCRTFILSLRNHHSFSLSKLV